MNIITDKEELTRIAGGTGEKKYEDICCGIIQNYIRSGDASNAGIEFGQLRGIISPEQEKTVRRMYFEKFGRSID